MPSPRPPVYFPAPAPAPGSGAEHCLVHCPAHSSLARLWCREQPHLRAVAEKLCGGRCHVSYTLT